ncbi:MAG: hypothetical protein WCY88_17375, partial [Spongiibacteraceae bacterium]
MKSVNTPLLAAGVFIWSSARSISSSADSQNSASIELRKRRPKGVVLIDWSLMDNSFLLFSIASWVCTAL